MEVRCLSVRVGDSAYGPGAQIEGLKHFLEDPENQKMVLELLDGEGGKGELVLRLDGDQLVVALSVQGLGFYLAKPF